MNGAAGAVSRTVLPEASLERRPRAPVQTLQEHTLVAPPLHVHKAGLPCAMSDLGWLCGFLAWRGLRLLSITQEGGWPLPAGLSPHLHVTVAFVPMWTAAPPRLYLVSSHPLPRHLGDQG